MIRSLQALTVWCYQGRSRLIILSGSCEACFNWSAVDQTLRRSSHIPLIRSNWLDRNMPGGRTVICCWCVQYKNQVKRSDKRGNYPTFLPGGFCPVPDETTQPRTTSTGPLLFQICLLIFFVSKTFFKMMQISSDSASNKHSLINVMHRFIAAANNMDETIMVPSLLRDVPLEERAANNNNHLLIDPDQSQLCSNKQRDMYEHYLLLKSIKNDMEWGLLKEMSSGTGFLEMAVKQQQEGEQQQKPLLLEDNADLEHQFHYHLRGLFGVLSKLTLQADHLTNRYKREIGGGNFMR